MQLGKRKSLTAAQQLVNLRGNPISRGDGGLHLGNLTWRYVATPSAFGRNYGVRIDYCEDSSPRVIVETPDLGALAGGRRIPHLYRQQPPRLCLYLPGTMEWQPWMLLDRTVVPWTALWLFYYEEWLLSDEWKGGGMHPDSEDDEWEAA
jgi:hypothetical protein